jgi:hypothetical protein
MRFLPLQRKMKINIFSPKFEQIGGVEAELLRKKVTGKRKKIWATFKHCNGLI